MRHIRIENLSFAYPNHSTVLQQINLTISAGEQVAILGQNGAGKTTLVRHLNGLLKPTSGQVWIGDRLTADDSTAQLAAQVGYVFQNPDDQIFCSTVAAEVGFGLRNLGWPQSEIQTRIEMVLAQLELSTYRDSNPYDLTLPFRKQVALASVIAMNPEVLILDEPTVGQDQAQLALLVNLLQQLRTQQRTVIAISHNLDFVVENFDRLIVLDRGRVLLDGAVPEVLSQIATMPTASIQLPQITRLAARLGLQPDIYQVEQLLAHLFCLNWPQK